MRTISHGLQRWPSGTPNSADRRSPSCSLPSAVLRFTAGRWNASWPEKKTADAADHHCDEATPEQSRPSLSFLALGGRAQQRYEALRGFMLLPRGQRPRSSSARFDLDRFARFGLVGLLECDPVGHAWWSRPSEGFQVVVTPVGTADAHDRRARLCAFLFALASGDRDEASRPLRPGLDGVAGEGADDPESARRAAPLRSRAGLSHDRSAHLHRRGL